MSDNLTKAVQGHIRSLRGSLEMMQSGWLKTSNDGHDTTSESISQTMWWIKELQTALDRHGGGDA